MNDEMTKKIARLKKLIALGDDKTNEAAAMAAMGKAAALAEEYGVSLDDLRSGVADVEFGPSKPFFSGFGKEFAPVDRYLWQHLPKFCDVILRATKDSDGDNCVQVLGHVVDVELFEFLRIVINRAMEFEWGVALYVLERHHADKVHTDARIASQKMSFMVGMAGRIVERMRELRADHNAPAMGTSTKNALVVAKADVIERVANSVGFAAAVAGRNNNATVDRATMAMGRASGDRVHLAREVGNTSRLAIGR